jgi:hypothetical protein
MAEAFNEPMERFLEIFGAYWVRFVGTSEHRRVLDLAGDSFETCLGNLDRLHSAVKISLPQAEVPSFVVLETAPERVSFVYTSRRLGLEPFVKGLVAGLLERFGREGRVVVVGPSGLGVLFHVMLAPQEAGH